MQTTIRQLLLSYVAFALVSTVATPACWALPADIPASAQAGTELNISYIDSLSFTDPATAIRALKVEEAMYPSSYRKSAYLYYRHAALAAASGKTEEAMKLYGKVARMLQVPGHDVAGLAKELPNTAKLVAAAEKQQAMLEHHPIKIAMRK